VKTIFLFILITIFSSGCALFRKKEKIVRPIKIYAYSSSTKKFCRNKDDCLKENETHGLISLQPEEFKKIGRRLAECYKQGNK